MLYGYLRRWSIQEESPGCIASGMMLSRTNPAERHFFIDNLLVRIHCIIVMTRWTGLAPWEFAPAWMLSRTNPAVVGRSGRLHVCGLRPADQDEPASG